MIFLPNVMTNIRFVCFLCNKMPKFSLLFRRVFSVYALIHAAIRVATVEYMMMKKLILINNFLFFVPLLLFALYQILYLVDYLTQLALVAAVYHATYHSAYYTSHSPRYEHCVKLLGIREQGVQLVCPPR